MLNPKLFPLTEIEFLTDTVQVYRKYFSRLENEWIRIKNEHEW